MKPREIRNWIPLSGFLQGKDRDMVSLHDLLEALLPLARLTPWLAAMQLLVRAWAPVSVSGGGLVGVRKSSFLSAPLAAAEDKKMS